VRLIKEKGNCRDTWKQRKRWNNEESEETQRWNYSP